MKFVRQISYPSANGTSLGSFLCQKVEFCLKHSVNSTQLILIKGSWSKNFVFKSNTYTLVDPPFVHVSFVLFGAFLFFPFSSVIDRKLHFNSETNEFDQQTACGAPVHWSKYTTVEGSNNDVENSMRLTS